MKITPHIPVSGGIRRFGDTGEGSGIQSEGALSPERFDAQGSLECFSGIRATDDRTRTYAPARPLRDVACWSTAPNRHEREERGGRKRSPGGGGQGGGGGSLVWGILRGWKNIPLDGITSRAQLAPARVSFRRGFRVLPAVVDWRFLPVASLLPRRRCNISAARARARTHTYTYAYTCRARDEVAAFPGESLPALPPRSRR